MQAEFGEEGSHAARNAAGGTCCPAPEAEGADRRGQDAETGSAQIRRAEHQPEAEQRTSQLPSSARGKSLAHILNIRCRAGWSKTLSHSVIDETY